MASRVVGDLDMSDQRMMPIDARGQVAFHDLGVVHVILQEQVVRPDGLDDLERLIRRAKKETRNIARVDGLDEQRDACRREAACGPLQVADQGLTRLLLVDAGRPDAREAVDQWAAEAFRVVDRPVHAFGELKRAVGVARDAALAAAPVPGRCVMQHLGEPVLVEPLPLLTNIDRLPGLDGDKKMSKSLGNTIHLSDTPDEVKKKVMRMYTDPKRVRSDIPGTVEGNPVFTYHDAFNPDTAQVDAFKARYRAGTIGDVEVKAALATALNARLDPIRERRAAALAKPGYLHEVLVEGSRRARVMAGETMARVREAIRIVYR